MKSIGERIGEMAAARYAQKDALNLKERSNKESLINQIVEVTNETPKGKKTLAKRIAIYANRYKLTADELHGLLAKHRDPKIRNFTAFVKWSIKDHEGPRSEPILSLNNLSD